MAIEVYQSVSYGSDYANWDQYAWELANFFSGSSHFTIIDSYSSARTLRHKGDPIADDDPGRPGTKYWDTVADVGNSNDWMVVQCETTIHGALGLPKWQVKFQWTNAAGFDDVSGLDYGFEGTIRIFMSRFAPKGSWDLEDTTPDFAPAGALYKSFNNRRFSRAARDADNRWILVANDGQLVAFDRKGSTTYASEFFLGYMGDYAPVDPASQLMPRCHHYGGDAGIRDVAAGGYLADDGAATGPSAIDGGLQYEDAAGNQQNVGYTNPGFIYSLDAFSQPCRHAILQEVDMVPYYLVPSSGGGLIGTAPMIFRGYGPGFTLLSGAQWLSLGEGNTPFVQWDGATPLSI